MNWMKIARSGWTRGALCAVAALLPVLLAVALSAGPFANAVVPDFVPGRPSSEQPATLLADLSSIMLSMSVGIGLGSVWLYRQPLRASCGHAPAAILSMAMLFGFVAIFSGLRFRYDMAQQLRFEPLDFDSLKNRLFWQGAALLLQTSALCVGGVVQYFWQEPAVAPAAARKKR